MVILDLEWNNGMDTRRFDEIVQIGAVKCSRLGRIEDTFNVWIKPKIHKKFGYGARKLLDLEMVKSSTTDFVTAYQAFLRWCGGETEFGIWGGDDLGILERSAVFFKQEERLRGEFYDIQKAFALTLGQDSVTNLNFAAEHCGIPDSFVFHNALNDAMYTSLVGSFVRPEDLAASRFSRADSAPDAAVFEKVPDDPMRHGPFKTVEKALNDRGCRRLKCPKCESMDLVSVWCSADGESYYAAFTCSDHGHYIRRLDLSRSRSGLWWANTEMLPAGEARHLLREAKKGKRFTCYASRRKKPKPANKGQ